MHGELWCRLRPLNTTSHQKAQGSSARLTPGHGWEMQKGRWDSRRSPHRGSWQWPGVGAHACSPRSMVQPTSGKLAGAWRRRSHLQSQEHGAAQIKEAGRGSRPEGWLEACPAHTHSRGRGPAAANRAWCRSTADRWELTPSGSRCNHQLPENPSENKKMQ